ncbi:MULTISPECIES: long-chain fatty acid--CoA ligase [unclassified Streptomyces]|uniref:Long-chain fatty acid--CoA ligase n=1 Tax=Streptomyces sp. NBC_00119 TaxID=2975659 RepID=A0AAU1U4P8_9ACTN|nr:MULTISPECIES: long-chain fatty acid--CoA ligase [unclassified Streptomyces]MCX4642401.1 long-chain fatty acid--CoA ligase [Streptomyces sp. NBC_01446]MCX5327342.1 long-chain fatty acid--CoA ligase [Streptomyces sp. NBC_00120]
MRNEGLGSWPARRARKTPHRTALIHGTTTVTYAALHERTTRLAHALRALGVRRGDRVAYLGPNHPSFLEALFATGLLGALFVPLNTRLADPELAFQIRDSGATVLLHAAARGGDLPGVRTAVEADGPAYEGLLAAAPVLPIDEQVGPDDVGIIMYTSGTTGRPKGAMLTHGNLTWNAVNVLVDQDLIADEIALVAAPLFHTAGLNMLTLPVLLKGGSCVLVGSFDAAATLELVERHRVTFMFGVPTMFDQLTRQPNWPDADLSSLRMLSCGGSPVPTPLIAAYQDRGLTFLQGYGMTEAAPGTLFLDAEHAVSKAGTAGVPHFFSDVRVARPDLAPVEPGETGEVLVRGPHVMRGYWGLPGESAAAFADGWFRTGDAARIDADGYVTIVDRFKDMIISGGENIYPAEVEDALLAHADIAECAVIGVPDEKWGEVGRAVLVAREGSAPDPHEVLGSLSGRLAPYKIPKSAVVVDALPRTASGKLVKADIRRLHGTS